MFFFLPQPKEKKSRENIVHFFFPLRCAPLGCDMVCHFHEYPEEVSVNDTRIWNEGNTKVEERKISRLSAKDDRSFEAQKKKLFS